MVFVRHWMNLLIDDGDGDVAAAAVVDDDGKRHNRVDFEESNNPKAHQCCHQYYAEWRNPSKKEQIILGRDSRMNNKSKKDVVNDAMEEDDDVGLNDDEDRDHWDHQYLVH